MVEVDSLLDRNEKTQYQIFQQFALQHVPLNIQDLLKQVEGSKQYLTSQLEALKYKTARHPELVWTKQALGEVLEIDPAFNVTNFYFEFLAGSLNYQLLLELYQKDQLDPPTVMTQFYLSESSYYRRIKELNQVLAEFNLKIKRGRLQGNESQIRYFFIQLFFGATPFKQLVAENIDPDIKNLLQIIQTRLKTRFKPFEYQRFFLILRVTKRRLASGQRGATQNLQALVPALIKEKSYQAIREIFFRYVSRYSFAWDETEIVLLYLFVHSFAIIPYNSDFFAATYESFEQQRLLADPKAPINQLNQMTLAFFDRFLVSKNFSEHDQQIKKYSILQLNLYLLYFEGAYVYFDRTNMFELESLVPGQNIKRESIALVAACYELLGKPFDRHGSKEATLFMRLSVLLTYFLRKYRQKVYIGVDHHSDELMRETLLLYLQDTLQSEGIYVEEAKSGKVYDLLLTNTDIVIPTIAADELFVLTDIASDKEISQIKQLIQERFVKTKRSE